MPEARWRQPLLPTDFDITADLHGGDRIYCWRYRYYECTVCIHQGAYQRDRYFESTGLFPEGYPVGVLLEASFTSLVGAVLGVLVALGITPFVQLFNVRVSLSVQGCSIVAVVWWLHRKYLRLLSGI